MKYNRPTGTNDILPEEAIIWKKVENVIRNCANNFSFGELITPVFENSDLFKHSVGESSDIVSKEMYTFQDKGGRELTLKPEGTASVARAYIENNLNIKPKPLKLYYYDRFYRYERPQKGRFREFHQFGAEVFGIDNPSADADLIMLSFEILNKLGFEDLSVNINSIGCRECRPSYMEKLKDYLKSHKDELCDDCLVRIDKNILRILDCKNQKCKDISNNSPKITDCLCINCKSHFNALLKILDKLNVPFKMDHHLVRGLDYYDKTVFEVLSPHLGSQNAILGGGRYDYLVEDIGGPRTPAVGFAMGIERIVMLLKHKNNDFLLNFIPSVYIVNFGEETLIESLKIARLLREKNISVDIDYDGKGIKKGLSYASTLGIKKVIIVGEDELKNNTLTIKDMDLKMQKTLSYNELIKDLTEKQENKL